MTKCLNANQFILSYFGAGQDFIIFHIGRCMDFNMLFGQLVLDSKPGTLMESLNRGLIHF